LNGHLLYSSLAKIKNQPQLSLGRLRLALKSSCVSVFTSSGDAHKLSAAALPKEEAVRKSEIIKAAVMHLSKQRLDYENDD
jgi:hypothetical protein